ncbi:MAG: hypothetical protein RL172_2188 [Bacteroidota bacterium]|jgi:serine-type D-Ala-D-Ala carboxypeptidase/endopeptidase (penicillin-binding protein 4)
MKYFMMKKYILLLLLATAGKGYGQTITGRLQNAASLLQADSQFIHAAIGMSVVDAATGQELFNYNGGMGLAPASCQKVITSAAAFSLLSSSYRYKTTIGYRGIIKDSVLLGDLFITGYGDPTLGSWRWPATAEEKVLQAIEKTLTQHGIKNINGALYCYDRNFESSTTPGGWPWEDIGNYYGAGAAAINWRENQYDLTLKPGNAIGDIVTVVSTTPALYNVTLHSEVTTAAKGSGDNAYIYLSPYSSFGYVRGTIPAGQAAFTISGAMPDAANQLALTLADRLKKKGYNGLLYASSYNNSDVKNKNAPVTATVLATLQSPPLDSINYWLLKKSINLYAEALVKTIAFEKKQAGATATGLALITNFWINKGIDAASLNLKDGSGLSPANRVTPQALVKVLQYARQQSWYTSFYNALPEINGIRMKDGYIADVRSYAGYVKSASGKEYIVALIVNNFSGSAGRAREKIWRLLDILK